ncbi:unnamed protein product [Protopolystoma xenopodis]|uniref:Uncharacterized protein n=1 Tax=Protopolystoma xenopodis TaxID=117903 RepID=A0A448WH87_9PLAT|nr:unnamed protein product [Protopolystoma xenopodis]
MHLIITYKMILFGIQIDLHKIGNNVEQTYCGDLVIGLRFSPLSPDDINYKSQWNTMANDPLDQLGFLEVWVKEGKNLLSQTQGSILNVYTKM